MFVCVTIFKNDIVNNKGSQHANLIFTEPWVLANEIMLNVMLIFNLTFSKSNFKPTGVNALTSIFKTLHSFSTEFFPMCRGKNFPM